MSNHTPGPWYVIQTHDGYYVKVETSTHELISDIRLARGYGLPNACLIAAAPTMLAALERIANTLEEEHDGEEFEVTFMHAQEIARAAIAKAKGLTEDKLIRDGEQAFEAGGQEWAEWNARALDFGDDD